MCNRKGSVIVDFSLWVDVGITDKDLLRNTLLNENNFKIGGYNVDHKSIRLSGKFHLFVSIKTILVQRDFADKHHATFILCCRHIFLKRHNI